MRAKMTELRADAAGLVRPLRKKLPFANTAYGASSPAGQLRHHRGEAFDILRDARVEDDLGKAVLLTPSHYILCDLLRRADQNMRGFQHVLRRQARELRRVPPCRAFAIVAGYSNSRNTYP